MKKIQKILLLLLVCTTLVTLTGCGGKTVDGSLDEIMTKIYADISQDELPMLENIHVLDLEEPNLEYYIGTDEIEYEDILVSEPMMSSVAYSVVLVRMKDGADIEDAKTKITENIDPAKWVCVEVAPEDVIIKNKGNLIILIMVENETTRNKIEEGFDNL